MPKAAVGMQLGLKPAEHAHEAWTLHPNRVDTADHPSVEHDSSLSDSPIATVQRLAAEQGAIH